MKIHDLLRHQLVVLFAVSLLSFSAGCSSKRAGDDVAATVDGRKIYRVDVEKYYQNQTAGSDQAPIWTQVVLISVKASMKSRPCAFSEE